MEIKDIIKSIRKIVTDKYVIEIDNINMLEDELIRVLNNKYNLSKDEEKEIRKYIKLKIKSLGN